MASSADKKKLREDINKKFINIKIFSKVSKISYKKIINILNNNDYDVKYYDMIVTAYHNTKMDEVPGYINEEDRKKIRLTILTNFDSYTAFHEKHEEYNPVYLTNIVKGRLLMETTKYNKLVRLLKREYNLEL